MISSRKTHHFYFSYNGKNREERIEEVIGQLGRKPILIRLFKVVKDLVETGPMG